MKTGTSRNRLIMLSSCFHPSIGGAERQGLALASSLRARNLPVVILTLHDSRRRGRCGYAPVPLVGIDYPNVRVIGPAIAYCRGIRALRRLSRRRTAVAQIQSLDPFTLSLGLAAKAFRIPLLIRISGAYEMNLGYLSLRGGGVRPLLAKWLLRSANHVLALNPEIEQRLVNLGVKANAIIRLPNAIPDDYFRITPVPASSRKLLRAPAVLLMGRLAPFKGGDHMLRAWKILADRHPGASLHFVGEGPLRSDLESLSMSLGINDCVKFWGASHDVPRFYSETDIFVLPSIEEGMPNGLLEAMAAGLPCVASDLPATRGIIECGRTGLLVPPSDEPALADAINRLLNDQDLRLALGRGARERVAPWAFSRLTDDYSGIHARMLKRVPQAVLKEGA